MKNTFAIINKSKLQNNMYTLNITKLKQSFLRQDIQNQGKSKKRNFETEEIKL